MAKYDLVKKILFGGTTVAAALGFLGCSEPVEPNPIDNAPRITHSYLSSTSGTAPLKVTAQLTCEDDKAVTGYTLISGNDTIRTRNPIDIIITYNESTDITRECEDAKEQKAVAGPTRIEILQPSYSQTAEVRDSVNVKYNATLENINRAILEVKNGNFFSFTDTITTPSYMRDFNDLPKWDNLFILTPDGLKPDTVKAVVAQYIPTIDLEGLATDFDEGDSLIIDLEERVRDTNKEDNPVPISVTLLSGDLETILDGYLLKIKGNSSGTYEVEIKAGSNDGGISLDTLRGNLLNLFYVRGQLQNNETDSGEFGRIKVYNSLDTTLLKEVLTDVQGNFDFKLDQPLDTILLQARLETGIPDSNYVRTITLSAERDTVGLVVKGVPNTGLSENNINREDFVSHLKEVNESFTKPSPNLINIEILYESPTRGVFTPEEQNLIKKTIEESNCYIGGRQFNIQVDSLETPDSLKHYKMSPDGFLTPDSTWVFIVPDPTAYTSTAKLWDLDRDRFFQDAGRINLKNVWEFVITHELGHIYMAGYGHAWTLNGAQTVMRNTGSLSRPGPADCKAAQIIQETTYPPSQKSLDNLLGRKAIDDILGLNFFKKFTL